MSEEVWKAVDEYFVGQLLPSDLALEAATAANKRAGLPAIDVTPAQGKFLHLLALCMGARRILELGTLGGYSTIWLARALPADGLLVSLEAEEKHATVARENIERAGLSRLVRIHVGKALEILPGVKAQYPEPFDLVFIDADKPATPAYFTWALKLTRPGSIIIADNVVRKGEIANAQSKDESVLGMRRFTEIVGNEPRVAATCIQTVGAKGYDGFVIARVAEKMS